MDPKIDVALVRKVLRHVKAEPARLEMKTWGVVKGYSSLQSRMGTWPKCGKRGCFAGWVLFLTIPEKKLASIVSRGGELQGPNGEEVGEYARDRCGFTDQEASDIFTGNATCVSGFEDQYAALVYEINTVFADRGMKERVK